MLFPQKIKVVAHARHINPHREVVVVQNDTAVEFLVAVIGDNGQTQLPSETSYVLTSLHVRKRPTQKLGVLQEDGNILFNLDQAELNKTGTVQAYIQAYHPEKGRITSHPFTYHVAPDPIYGAEIRPPDKSLIEQVLGEGPAIIAEAKAETELSITERTRLTDEVDGALLEMSQSKDAADQSAQAAQQAADDVSDKLNEVETARSATVEATGEATEAAGLARDEADAARLQKEEVQQILGAGPVASVNGKTGVVTGVVEEEALNLVNQQLAEKVEKGEVSVSDINKNLGKFDQTYMTAEFLQQIAGTTPVNAVPAIRSITPTQLAFAKTGKNKFNKYTVTSGQYVSPTTGALVASANYFTSDYIPVDSNADYRVAHAGFYALYDANKAFVSGGNPAGSYLVNTGATGYFLRASTSNGNIDTFQVEKGSVRTGYEAFYEKISKEYLETPVIKTGDLELNAITPESTQFIKHGKNYYDKSTAIVDKYINHITGTADTNTSYNASDYMIVEPNTSFVQSHGYGIAFYDRNKNFLSGLTTGANNRVVTTPANAYFMRSSVAKSINDTFQIEKGTVATAYESYRLIIDKLNTDANASASIELLLPPKIYGVVGKEVNIYFDNIISDANINNLQIDVVCSVGIQQSERWTLTPTAAGAYPLTVNIYKDFGTLIKTATASVVIKAASVGTGVSKSALIIGDSTTDSGIVTGELLNLFGASDPMDITLLGTRGTGTNKHEGRAGWSAGNYINSASVGTVPNAFWNPATPAFDFSYYMTQQAYTSVDYVGIHLGINDMFGQTGDASALNRANITKDYINAMVTSIKAYNPNVKIGVLLTIPPSASQDAFGKDYGSGETRWRFKRSIDLLVKALIQQFAGREAENIYVVPYNVNLDTKNNMATETVPANSRNTTTVVRQSNGVHPANSGYYQMADVLYYFIKSFEV